ncbi:MAG TPA: FecR family protein, partial [Kiritimatiellia bacterium]|nr:FecR family protein [Kiritimatiellia bacterium]
MIPPREEFMALVGRIIDGDADQTERERFAALLREYPDLITLYREQVDTDVLVGWHLKQSIDSSEVCVENECGRVAPPHRPVNKSATVPHAPTHRKSINYRAAIAAAAAVALAGGVLRLTTRGLHGNDKSARYTTSKSSAIVCLAQHHAVGLSLPHSLPGIVRLDAGLVVARLPSGVELRLLGPSSLEVCDAMQVRLESGRLLADVPPHAVGFTVQTQELELWDLGTVFGVTVSDGVSDVFVFQGSVQVNESAGEAVDLCEAGQGVRAVAGRRPYKVAADFPEAAAHYRAVAGRQKALRDPAAALAASDRIAALWGEHRLPKVVPPPPPPVAGLRGKVTGKKEEGRGNRQSPIANRQSPIANRQLSPSVGGRASSVQELSQTTAAARP